MEYYIHVVEINFDYREEMTSINLDLLKQLLAQAKITQPEMARMMGRHRTNLNMKLNGHLAFTVDEMGIVFSALGISDPLLICQILYGKTDLCAAGTHCC